MGLFFLWKEEESHWLRVPGQAADRVFGESGEDQMHGQGMSRGDLGGPDEIGH